VASKANVGRQIVNSRPATLRGKIADRQFSAADVLDEFERLPDQTILAKLLAKTDRYGNSPYQDRIDVIMNRHSSAEQKEVQEKLKSLIHTRLDGIIPDIRTALYGTRATAQRELCLDMSDFNSSSHDFGTFVKKLLDETVVFESTLFHVYLPDLNYFPKKCPHDGVRALFDWLAKKGSEEKKSRVEAIIKLNMRDNTTAPMSDELVKEAIIDSFKINIFDWRKLDINLDILTNTDNRVHFTELTLYSSGNWSTLYHWSSHDGLGQLPNVCGPQIVIERSKTRSTGSLPRLTKSRHSYKRLPSRS